MTGSGLKLEMAKTIFKILSILILVACPLQALGQNNESESGKRRIGESEKGYSALPDSPVLRFSDSFSGEDIKKLLPAPQPFPEIKSASRPAVYTADTLEQAIRHGASIIKEYGFVERIDRPYDSQYGEIDLELYRMKDFKAAFGLYTYFKAPVGKTIRMGDGGYMTAREVIFWQNDVCVRLHSQSGDEAAMPLMRRLAQSVAGKIGRHSTLPVLITYLPEDGLQPGTVRYFLGPQGFRSYYDPAVDDPWGFKEDIEIEIAVADYQVNGETGKLVLLGYPNHPLAIHYFKSIVPAMQKSRKANEAVYMKRAGVLVAVLVGNFDQATADKILAEITYADSVKWIYDKRGRLGERSAAYNVLPILSTVVSSFFLIGLACLLSILLGAIFGSVMFYLRRRVPAVAGRRQQEAMIRLNIYNR